MDLSTGDVGRRMEKSESSLGTATFQQHHDGGAHGIPNGSVLHGSDDDPTSRKRQRTMNGPICCSVPTKFPSASQTEDQRSNELDVVGTSKVRDSRAIGDRVIHGEHCWSTRSGSRVTSLYAELVRELEAQVAELHQLLASRNDAAALREWRIQELEQENKELKRQIQSLEEQNDALSRRVPSATRDDDRLLEPESHCVVAAESNASFLKNLSGFQEPNTNSQLSASQMFSTPISSTESKVSSEIIASPIMPPVTGATDINTQAEPSSTPPEGMLRVSGVTSGFQYWMKMDESGESTLPESCVLWEEPLQETLPDGTPAWASPIETNGRPKLELVPESGVYITYQQLEDLSHIPADKPKLMTRRLLDYFFSRETLARSSATGQRTAHNNTTMEKPLRLPEPVVTAIKAYVTKACGRGCNFNAVINSKCGTSRRAVKKMSIRIDWTEGGAKHCPRTASITSAQKGQFHHEKAPTMRGTETLLPQSVPLNN
ncbi:uncharacterized protein LOC128471626 [Spea bombifrons]|uniref:uncharacterized protein LOC128471626 n=1 Tax=Spea bombifrons TaxID=233779 RepID=UPI002349AE50|nr:uncharacterized protein LOC128471626 [Spea bombifrons]XP_053309566.1 uncharacterized protein LOC128471626 [Spea bombifrons]